MKERTIAVLPRIASILEKVGENLRLGRLRRRLSTTQIAERSGISRKTLYYVEKGASHVSIAAYAQVLFVLGLEKDLLMLAQDDEVGHKIQDTGLIIKKRATKK